MKGFAHTVTVTGGRPFCVGITTPALSEYPTKVVAGHEMSLLPGGFTVIGSPVFGNAQPRWVLLPPYGVGKTAVSEFRYRTIMARPGNERTPDDHPANCIFYRDAVQYVKKCGCGLNLPFGAQRENAARGPAGEMREAMERETGRFSAGDFAAWAKGRFENFVFGVLANPLRPETREFRMLVARGLPFWGWHMYGTKSGCLTPDEAWYGQPTTAPVEWGSANAYGVKGMAGGISEWIVWRHPDAALHINLGGIFTPAYRASSGNSWCERLTHYQQAASTNYFDGVLRGENYIDQGFRVYYDPRFS